MRLTLLASVLLFATYAAAQPAPDQGGPDQPPPTAQGQPDAPVAQHPRGGPGFDAANTTQDGRLTRDQAQAGGMKNIARHFDQIDTDRKGYVTKQDIRAWRQAKKAAKQARTQQQGPGASPPPGTPPASDAPPPSGQEQPGPPPQ